MNRKSSPLIAAILAVVSLFAPISVLSNQTQKNQSGKISGLVLNVTSGDPLIKAGVEAIGQGVKAETGADGDYTLSLPPGTYSIRVFREGFVEQTIEKVEVKSGATTELNAVLQPVGAGEQVTVTAGASNDAAALIEDRKAATTISETISAVEIAKDTASSAAGVLQRAPGISLVNDFVFVRGLGERYSNTSLNDAILPTTEPDRKVVPMDLIPAAMLQNMRILKTFTPDQPGEFSGGLVKLETVDLPKAASLSVSYSMGFNTATHGEDFLGYPGGGLKDFFGFGKSERRLPDGIPGNERLLRSNPFLPGGFSPAQLEAIGESFENIWEPRAEEARPNVDWSIAGGDTFGKFGLVGALSFKRDLQSLDERRIFYQVAAGNEVIPQHTYDYTSSTATSRLGGTLNAAYEIGKNHRLNFKNFITNQATDETRIFEGFNDDRRTDLLNTRLRYIEERIYTGQLSGTHLIAWLGDSIINWRYTYSRATLDEPDLRETLYEFNQNVNEFIYFNQTQSLFRLFNEMRENVREPAIDWGKYWFFRGVSLNAKAGASYINRDRVFDSRRFRFVPRGLQGIDTSARPEQLLVPQNIGQETGFEIREETRPTDHYDALHNITAGYLMADFSWRRWRFIGGARVEKSEQAVNTFEPFRPEVVPSSAILKDTDVLPSIGIAYSTNGGGMSIRAGYSKTLARPQFRELSPFEFTDVTGGRSTIGNPDITRTLISNYDLRWEWFIGPTELLAVSVFHKDLDDPIEVVIEPTAQLRTSFRNVDGARNTGFEIELRKNIGVLWKELKNLFLNANYTFVRSRVQIGQQDLSVLTTLERPLVGQAENIFNLALDYDIPRFNMETRALFNYTGERITDVGALGLPDIIEHGRPILDFLVAKYWGGEKKVRVEFSAENVLNRQIDFRQDDQPFRVYRRGRTFKFGVSYRFF
ncbi:MAG: outer membrane beta-barrel protein [Acidobacteriota bacterium]